MVELSQVSVSAFLEREEELRGHRSGHWEVEVLPWTGKEGLPRNLEAWQGSTDQATYPMLVLLSVPSGDSVDGLGEIEFGVHSGVGLYDEFGELVEEMGFIPSGSGG